MGSVTHHRLWWVRLVEGPQGRPGVRQTLLGFPFGLGELDAAFLDVLGFLGRHDPTLRPERGGCPWLLTPGRIGNDRRPTRRRCRIGLGGLTPRHSPLGLRPRRLPGLPTGPPAFRNFGLRAGTNV